MVDIVVGVKLTADGQQFVVSLDQAQAKVKQLGDNAGVAGRLVDEATGYLARLATIGAGIALAKKLAEISDEAAVMKARLADVIPDVQQLSDVQAQLLATSNSLGFAYKNLAGGFAEVGRAIIDTGGSARDATQVVEALANATKASGQSTEQAQQIMEQFANVLTLGVQGGRDLTAILRENDNVARALADGLGVTTQALRKMAQDGEISGDQLVKALLSQFDKLKAQAQAIPPTIGGAFTRMWNDIAAGVGNSGAGGAVGRFLNDAVGNFEAMRDAGVNAGIAIAAQMVGLGNVLAGVARQQAQVTAEINKSRSAAGKILGATNPVAFGDALSGLQQVLASGSGAAAINAQADVQSKVLLQYWARMQKADADGAEKYWSTVSAELKSIEQRRQLALQELAKRGQVSFGAWFGDIDAAVQQEKQGFTLLQQIQQQGLAEQSADLEFAHQAFLVSDEQYYQQRAAIARQAALDQAAAAKSAYAADLEQFQQVQAKAAIGADDLAAKNRALSTLAGKLTSDVVAWSLAEAKATQAGVDGAHAITLAQQKLRDEITQITRSSEDYARSLDQQVADLQLQLSIIGQTATFQQQATAARQIDVGLANQLLDIERKISDEKDHQNRPDVLAALEKDRQDAVDKANAAKTATAGLVAQIQAANDRTQALTDAFHAVDDEAYQLFQKFGSGWKGVMQEAADDVKRILVRALYEMTVQKWIVSIFTNVGAASATQGAGSTLTALGALGGGAGSPLGSLASTGGLLGGSGGLLGGAGGLVGGGFGAALGAGGSAGLATLGIASEAGVGAIGGLGAAFGAGLAVLGAAIPYLGIALAAYSLIAGNKKPSPVKGQFGVSSGTGGFEDNAFTASQFGNLGFVDAGTQQFSGQAAQVFNQEVAGALNAIATRLSPDAIARVAKQLQGTTFAGKEGDFTTEDFIKQYGVDVLKQVLTTAFQELNPAMAQLVSVFKGSADEVVAYANSLLALNDAISGDPAADAAKAYAATQQTAYDAFVEQGKTVEDLAAKFDGSAASTTALANATATYRGELVNLLVQLKQVGAQIHAMFQDTRTSIEQAGLTPQQRYAYDQQQAQSLYEQVFQTKDPALIQQLTQRIDGYINDAFSQLNPDEQLANKPAFLSHLTDVDTAIGNYLTSLGDTLNTQGGATFTDVSTAINTAAGKFGDAATGMQGAATTQQTAAQGQQSAASTIAGAAGDIKAAADRIAGALSNIRVSVDFETAAVGG